MNERQQFFYERQSSPENDFVDMERGEIVIVHKHLPPHSDAYIEHQIPPFDFFTLPQYYSDQ